MRHCFFLLLFVAFSANVLHAQNPKIAAADLKTLKRLDDSLGDYGNKIWYSQFAEQRLRADSFFTRLLVRAMRLPYSFYYQFDSVETASVQYPPDSSFRLITWHYSIDDENIRQRGALQMNTPDGSLKFFPLYDVSEISENLLDSIRTPQNWVGAVYYKILQNNYDGKKVYTLLGYDENNLITTRKWIEQLRFNDKGEPRWGGNFIGGSNSDSMFPRSARRFLMEYKKGSSAKINFVEDEDMIVMDDLMSETNEPQRLSTLVPSGDARGFKFVAGNWVYVPMLAIENRGDNNAPNAMQILDDNGAANEAKLQAQSEKNANKGNNGKKKDH